VRDLRLVGATTWHIVRRMYRWCKKLPDFNAAYHKRYPPSGVKSLNRRRQGTISIVYLVDIWSHSARPGLAAGNVLSCVTPLVAAALVIINQTFFRKMLIQTPHPHYAPTLDKLLCNYSHRSRTMDRRCSFGLESLGSQYHRGCMPRRPERELRQGSAINFHGNPCFHP
jgi:hypothetical protein